MKDMIEIGIDVGLTGAIATIDNGRVGVQDMPVKERVVNGKKTQELDFKKLDIELWEISEQKEMWADPPTAHATLEAVQAMKRKDKKGNFVTQGVASTFKFGRTYGATEMCLVCNEIEYTKVSPQKWKRYIFGRTGTTKSDSIDMAISLYPDAKKFIWLKKHDGRAEALLLAHYGLKMGGGE
jgi:hypothetical protein